MGVPQGSILSPLLFTLFVNDFPTVVQSCKVMLYADNTTIYHSCHDSRQLQDTLANDLSSIANWLKTSHLQMNVTKTKLLLLARRSRIQEFDKVKLSVNGVEIERRDDVKFLGVVMTRVGN